MILRDRRVLRLISYLLSPPKDAPIEGDQKVCWDLYVYMVLT